MGIKISYDIKGLDKLEKKINKISKELTKKVEQSVEDILKNIQGYAIRLEKGHNEKGILVEMIETSTMEAKGKVYAEPSMFMTDNNTSYLWFEYFGTGKYAEMEHIGNTTHFIKSGFTEWLIPVKANLNLNYKIITIKDNQFYLAHGVKSNHFLENAEFKTRNENREIVKEKLKELFEEVCR